MQRSKLIPLFGFAALLCACGGGDMSDLELFIAKTKQAHHGKVDPLPEFPPYQTYTYDAQNIRDPFRAQTDLASAEETDHNGLRPETDRRREPLESFPVDSLKMVGLLQQKAQIWALVRDPDGTIHRVQPGNYAGQNYGQITQVSESKIDIVELVPDGLSGWVNRDAVLAMAEE